LTANYERRNNTQKIQKCRIYKIENKHTKQENKYKNIIKHNKNNIKTITKEN
jgi:hypothetical protein